MKKLFLIALIPLTSCTKEWKCQTTGEYIGIEINAHSTFYGTKPEMHEYEAINTTSYAITTCK